MFLYKSMSSNKGYFSQSFWEGNYCPFLSSCRTNKHSFSQKINHYKYSITKVALFQNNSAFWNCIFNEVLSCDPWCLQTWSKCCGSLNVDRHEEFITPVSITATLYGFRYPMRYNVSFTLKKSVIMWKLIQRVNVIALMYLKRSNCKSDKASQCHVYCINCRVKEYHT